MKGLPLANRWPYTDGSVGLVTSGESAKLFQKPFELVSHGRINLSSLQLHNQLNRTN